MKLNKTKVRGNSQHIRIGSGAEDAWYYENDSSIHVVVWPNKIPGHVQSAINLHIRRSQLAKYLERSKP